MGSNSRLTDYESDALPTAAPRYNRPLSKGDTLITTIMLISLSLNTTFITILIIIVTDIFYNYYHVYFRYNETLHRWSVCCPDVVVAVALVARGLCYVNSALNPVIYNFMSGKNDNCT